MGVDEAGQGDERTLAPVGNGTAGDEGRGSHRGRLEQERERLAQQLAALERSLEELVAHVDLEPPDDEHDPDGVTAYERAQVRSLAAEARARLAALDEVLATADDDALTRCRACGERIDPARLDALPSTTRCIRCAASGR